MGREPFKSLPRGVVLVALDGGGMALAEKIRAILPGAMVHGLAGRTREADETFVGTADHLRALFGREAPIVGICAAGILIRALAPLLADKKSEPPVIAVAGDGSAVVPLLGGHHGANRLAAAIARATNGTAAVTTAGDTRLGLALDDPPEGWRLANPSAAKGIMAALLAGEPVGLRVAAGDASWISESQASFVDSADLTVRVTDKHIADPGDDLILHPPVLALGVGCERGVPAAELLELAMQTLLSAGLAKGAVACVVSIDVKSDEAAVLDLAAALDVPARFFSAAELEAQSPRLANPSDIVFAAVGCHGVAEGAALAAAGNDADLVIEKTGSRRATCAVARAPSPSGIDAGSVGVARGRLSVVGIGPGGGDWRTPEATRALQEADHVVGYTLYLDLIADLIAGKPRHDSPLSEEEVRVRKALDLAAAGQSVALVSSGDAGIYALATLVFELLDGDDRADWNRLEVTVVPGVSAFQAAAARMGAPVGHDFCLISLSDLLTPWQDIERRLRAAADGDFVVAFYNPVSKRRRQHLARARDILLTGRPPSTPVILARNLGRRGETTEIIRLDELAPERADMLTLVLVGSSRTTLVERGARRWVYTPRGYGSKIASPTKHRAKHRAKQGSGA